MAAPGYDALGASGKYGSPALRVLLVRYQDGLLRRPAILGDGAIRHFRTLRKITPLPR